jgi:deoxyinosine 3'endonuclease (endonuclease V)
MLAAFDTYYTGSKAKTIGVLFEQWQDEKPAQVLTDILEDVPEYEPGAFYKRELPCILSILKQIDQGTLTGIIIDGFVVLDDAGKPGLGAHLYEHLGRTIPVIGVAKTNFATNILNKRAVVRGESIKPLYITAAGFSPDEAAACVQAMHGPYRVPSILKYLDMLTRE